ncbi:MAG TPA: hypothetical protein VFG49_13825 [Dyella sp.]|uniref:tetratricopeptide repeat protein n=1 Tax=Dyella sp. TaxID=1869338 RepID=UPI002D76CAF0|nr:hypothetical protein [Dyella sp.]HET6554601.1 hypothetical protein [Dyella sp.]
MRKAGAFVLLLAAACAAHASKSKPETVTTPATQDVDAARENVRLAVIYARNGNMVSAKEALDRVMHVAQFERLPEKVRFSALVLAGGIAEDEEKPREAHDLLVRASAFAESDLFVWSNRLITAYTIQDYRDSARCVITIARRWPDKLDTFHERAFIIVGRELDASADQELQRDYLQALFDAGWKTSEGEPSEFWRRLASLWLRAGNTQKAVAAAARIQSARVVLAMRVDKQFDVLTRSNPGSYDVDRAVAREIEDAREQIKASPDRLAPVVRLQGLLLSVQHYDEVIALADDVQAKTRDGQGPSLYKDFDEKYIWLLDERSRALARLGRWDEAVRQWEVAARRPEQGGMNVSQIINLGQLYADLRRPREALDTVQELGNVSDYGRMQLEIVRLQAAIVQQDQVAIATHMDYMREHRNDAIATWQAALLQTGDMDGAATLLIERLGSEAWRSDALSEMQQYAPIQTTPMDAERMKRWRAVIARPDVQKALAKVGRVETFKLDPTET